VRWVLLPSNAPWPFPAPSATDLLTATSITAVFPAALDEGQGAGVTVNGDSDKLPSQAEYLLVAAAQDAAGNVQERLSNLTFVAPDVHPPLLTGLFMEVFCVLNMNILLMVLIKQLRSAVVCSMHCLTQCINSLYGYV
jgi:hypothetical protein